MLLEDELGYLMALVHRLEPESGPDKVLISGVYDSNGIFHYNDYKAKSILTPRGGGDFAYHKDISSPITEINDLTLNKLTVESLCIDCFKDASDLTETVSDEDLRTGLFIVAKFDSVSEGHDYLKIRRDNRTPDKIYQLACEYYSFMDETENYLNNLWMNIPAKYQDRIEDYLEKQPYKLDLVHKLSLGSSELKNSLRDHCEKLFNRKFSDEKEVMVALMPHYELESLYHKSIFNGSGRAEMASVDIDRAREAKDMHELAISLLSCYIDKRSYTNDVSVVPYWLIDAFKLVNPKVLLSQPYEMDDKVLTETALKLYRGDLTKNDLYSSFDIAMNAAKKLR